MSCRNTACRAQAGIVEFLILVLLMIFLAQKSLELAGKAKEGGLLLLERAIIDRSMQRIEFVLTELNATGAGKRTIIIQPKPFITYSTKYDGTSIILSAHAPEANYNSSIAAELDSYCNLDKKKSIKIVMEKWVPGPVGVKCIENPV